MPLKSLYILLPCHSLEDFPVHHRGSDAQGLLENWIAPWHPALIDDANSAPKWHNAEIAPEELTEALVLAPSVSVDSLPNDLQHACDEANALLIRDAVDRDSIASMAIKRIGDYRDRDPDLVGDFFALGYGYLQVQLMTRRLRHSSNLDEQKFASLVVEAAKTEDTEDARRKLQSCFDLLLEEKSRYYPVLANLVDLTLLAETTLGKSFRDELQIDIKHNLLLPGQLCELLESNHPDSFRDLQKAVADERVEIVGGNQRELPDPLISSTSIIRNLRTGRKTILEKLETQPSVYLRRTNGLTPGLPEILEKLRYLGVLHATLDEGRFPTGMSANTRWESPSGESLIALSRTPLDASQPETFLDLGVTIGEDIDSEHYATIVFAHWPNKVNRVYKDLQRIHRFGPLLGDFVSFTEHFESVYDPGYGEIHQATDYRNAYLPQAITRGQADPISRFVNYWKRTWKLRELAALQLITAIRNPEHQPNDAILEDRIDNDLIDNSDETLDDDLEKALSFADGSFTKFGPNTTVINTLSYPQRLSVRCKGTVKPTSQIGKIYVRDHHDGHTHWIVDCPPLGRLELDPTEQAKKAKLGPAVISETGLQNEYFQLRIDEETGGIARVNLYDRRANVLTQRLAFRSFSGHPKLDKPEYARMVNKKTDFQKLSHVAAKAISTGELLLDQRVVAEFQQTVSLLRGSRTIDFEVEFDSLAEFQGKGWDNYLCSRIAWAEETAQIRRELHHTKYKTNERRLCAPQYLEIDDMETKLTFITAGLPYHQRSGPRQLDTILVCPGETQRTFQFAIAVNEKYSSKAVATWHSPARVLPERKISDQYENWLFHFSNKSILVTDSKPIYENGTKLIGAYFRLQETEGRRGDLTIHCPRPIKSAQLIDLTGEPLESLKIQDHKILTDFLGSQMMDIQIHW
jgi:alpha-mannosidase